MTSLFNTPELFESLRNVSHHKAIADDHRDQLIKYGFVRQVFGGGLMLTGDGLEQLQNINKVQGIEKDKLGSINVAVWLNILASIASVVSAVVVISGYHIRH